MNIEYKFLSEKYIPELREAWHKAFANYQVDMSYLTLERMISRARMDRVDYNLSVGAFHNNEMCGFLIIGIDKINNVLSAFDAGTGVIPEYRGKGIAGAMFDFVVPKLKSKGVQNFILEVIQENQAAINTYKKTGFSISRNFKCYKLDTKNFTNEIESLPDVRIKSKEESDIENCLDFIEWDITWEYNIDAIKNIQEELIMDGAFVEGNCVGFIVYYPTLEWIFILAKKEEFKHKKIDCLLLTQLINKVKSKVPVIKFNNILSDHEMCGFLEKYGFELYTTQHEMIYSLSK
jgi:ribosomal protein S18 acetylase RimI-like enzyme